MKTQLRNTVNKYQLLLTKRRVELHHANVLQTKVDAQFDKLAAELSWQRVRRSTFSSYSELFVEVTNFNLPHLHLAPLLGMTPFEFCEIFGIRKRRD